MPASETDRAMREREALEAARGAAERLAEEGERSLYLENYEAAATKLRAAADAARRAGSSQKRLEHYIDRAASQVPYA